VLLDIILSRACQLPFIRSTLLYLWHLIFNNSPIHHALRYLKIRVVKVRLRNSKRRLWLDIEIYTANALSTSDLKWLSANWSFVNLKLRWCVWTFIYLVLPCICPIVDHILTWPSWSVVDHELRWSNRISFDLKLFSANGPVIHHKLWRGITSVVYHKLVWPSGSIVHLKLFAAPGVIDIKLGTTSTPILKIIRTWNLCAIFVWTSHWNELRFLQIVLFILRIIIHIIRIAWWLLLLLTIILRNCSFNSWVVLWRYCVFVKLIVVHFSCFDSIHLVFLCCLRHQFKLFLVLLFFLQSEFVLRV